MKQRLLFGFGAIPVGSAGLTLACSLMLLAAAVLIAIALLSPVGCTFNPPAAVGRPLVVVETLEGDRFEPEPARRAGLVPSSLFWLADGERIFVRWHDYLLVYPEEGAPFPQCRLCPHELRRCDENVPDRWCFWCLSTLRGGEWSVWGRPTSR